jgi:hypothetical protein
MEKELAPPPGEGEGKKEVDKFITEQRLSARQSALCLWRPMEAWSERSHCIRRKPIFSMECGSLLPHLW